MALNMIDESQRKAARVAGFAFLFGIAIVILANYGIDFRLIVPGNAADTARNIMTHEAVTAMNSFTALRLLGDAAYLSVFHADQLQTLARLHLAANFDAYYVGLPFWGLASTVCGYLWFKSRYIPRALAAFGVISSAWCVICAFAYIVFPHVDATVNLYWFDVPMTIFEMLLGAWLLFKGLSPSGQAGSDKAS